jgi:hypothetical protein
MDAVSAAANNSPEVLHMYRSPVAKSSCESGQETDKLGAIHPSHPVCLAEYIYDRRL